ncbi:MAG: branched-chain amino acid ABC transporter permease [Candidatus Lambdaproteobacteria bacterium]|nr:branched-chain amino acid ABC transporter permease [Candidatus Lambdaproteobacteria bacterium]
MSDYLIGVLSNIGMIAFLALSAYVLLVTGSISFGQQAYFAISAYGSGIATAMWGWPLWLGMLWGAALAGLAAALVAVPTARLHGLYFAVATLAFAEMVRLLLQMLTWQIDVDGTLIGPMGSEGFREIRYIYAHDISAVQFMLLIYGLLGLVVGGLTLMERTRLGLALRMIGEDEIPAEALGVNVAACKIFAAALSGIIAGIGGALYAHLITYIEPALFNVMLGVHGLAYGLIGGLGTAVGPLLGVVLDIGFLESVRAFAGYRMIVFGGLVALLLIVRPRGLLDEVTVHRIVRRLIRSDHVAH